MARFFTKKTRHRSGNLSDGTGSKVGEAPDSVPGATPGSVAYDGYNAMPEMAGLTLGSMSNGGQTAEPLATPQYSETHYPSHQSAPPHTPSQQQVFQQPSLHQPGQQQASAITYASQPYTSQEYMLQQTSSDPTPATGLAAPYQLPVSSNPSGSVQPGVSFQVTAPPVSDVPAVPASAVPGVPTGSATAVPPPPSSVAAPPPSPPPPPPSSAAPPPPPAPSSAAPPPPPPQPPSSAAPPPPPLQPPSSAAPPPPPPQPPSSAAPPPAPEPPTGEPPAGTGDAGLAGNAADSSGRNLGGMGAGWAGGPVSAQLSKRSSASSTSTATASTVTTNTVATASNALVPSGSTSAASAVLAATVTATPGAAVGQASMPAAANVKAGNERGLLHSIRLSLKGSDFAKTVQEDEFLSEADHAVNTLNASLAAISSLVTQNTNIFMQMAENNRSFLQTTSVMYQPSDPVVRMLEDAMKASDRMRELDTAMSELTTMRTEAMAALASLTSRGLALREIHLKRVQVIRDRKLFIEKALKMRQAELAKSAKGATVSQGAKQKRERQEASVAEITNNLHQITEYFYNESDALHAERPVVLDKVVHMFMKCQTRFLVTHLPYEEMMKANGLGTRAGGQCNPGPRRPPPPADLPPFHAVGLPQSLSPGSYAPPPQAPSFSQDPQGAHQQFVQQYQLYVQQYGKQYADDYANRFYQQYEQQHGRPYDPSAMQQPATHVQMVATAPVTTTGYGVGVTAPNAHVTQMPAVHAHPHAQPGTAESLNLRDSAVLPGNSSGLLASHSPPPFNAGPNPPAEAYYSGPQVASASPYASGTVSPPMSQQQTQ